MKRTVSFILALVLFCGVCVSLTGCGKKSAESKLHILSRGEWIGRIAEVFNLSEPVDSTPKYKDVSSGHKYFNEIQACNEWEIIENEDNFRPDDRADVEFGIVTAVKAVGLDRIAKEENGVRLNTGDEIIEYFNSKGNIKYIKGSNLYQNTAEQILDQLKEMYLGTGVKQVQDISMKAGVYTIDDTDVLFSGDGKTAKVINGSYSVGDIICIEPSVLCPTGVFAKITNVDGDTINYVNAELDEVYEHIVFSGEYEPELLGVVPLMDGVVIEMNDEGGASTIVADGKTGAYYARTGVAAPMRETKLNDISFTFGNNGMTGRFAIENIKVITDFELAFLTIKRAEMRITNTVVASLNFAGAKEDTYPIAKLNLGIWGPIGAEVVVNLKVGIEGELSIVYSVDTIEGVEYVKKAAPKFIAEAHNSRLDVDANAKLTVMPALKAYATVGPWKVAGIGGAAGIVGTAKLHNSTETGVECVDLEAYLKVTAFVGGEGDETMLSKLNVKKSWTIFDKGNTPLQAHIHIENGQVVPECTVKDKQDDHDPSEGGDDGSAEDGIDYDLIASVNEAIDNISLAVFYVSVKEGQSDTLGVKYIPAGYTMGDLVFESDDPSVAAVGQNGSINGVKEGLCYIKVSTSDGKFAQYCTVRVFVSYEVDFTPLVAMKADSTVFAA
ncbi:MAG: Ig-like domain-containing protein [Clostridia bacterium]|nr:Ig-like domain-containing protein [Clostridia bacterium]